MRAVLHFGGRFTRAAGTAAMLAAFAACSGVTDSLLDVEDPDLIMPENASSAAGAIAVANGALGRLRNVTAGAESTWMFGGLLADEWGTSSTFIQNDETDWRKILDNNSQVQGMLRRLYLVRTAATQGAALLKEFNATRTALMGEMFFARGFAELQLASDFCNGIPLSDGSTQTPVYTAPLPVATVFTAAMASFDSALLVATGTDAQSVLIQRAARVGKARAQLGNNQFAAAATTVAGIPTSFRYQSTFSLTTSDNIIWNQGTSAKRYSVADNLEGNSRNLVVKNAIPFFSARDPRLPVTDTRTVGQDGGTFVRTTTLYDRLTAIDVVNGIDARLIEAEAALRGGNATQWLAILNGLRTGTDRVTSVGTVTLGATALAPLTMPASDSARVSLHFYEKAFWTFSRGQRLGDMRRLVRQFGRAPEDVYPVGIHYKTSRYGDDVVLPVTVDESTNPNLNGAPACLDRKA
ncbi:MAG: hypothetical protein IPK85_14920 [Gemmatimonadetes bacterium]|nr:hypothetical protein [Gemmatimonadota bacterium]